MSETGGVGGIGSGGGDPAGVMQLDAVIFAPDSTVFGPSRLSPGGGVDPLAPPVLAPPPAPLGSGGYLQPAGVPMAGMTPQQQLLSEMNPLRPPPEPPPPVQGWWNTPPPPGGYDIFALERPSDPFIVPAAVTAPIAPLMPEALPPPPASGPASGWSDAQSLAYIASYPDLSAAFGTDPTAGRQHFNDNGAAEGRGTIFNAVAYLAANPDVAAAFGGDPGAAAIHYITFGRAEGRWTAPGVPPSTGPVDSSTLTPAGSDFPPGAVLTADGSLLVPASQGEGDPNIRLAAGPLTPVMMGLLNLGIVALGGLFWQRYRAPDGGPMRLPQPIAPMPPLPPLVTPIPEPARPDIESLTPPVVPDMSTLITAMPDSEVAWTDPGFTPIDLDPVEILERNVLAGKMREAGADFPDGWEAHHLVPRRDGRFPEAIRARQRLADLEIDINDAVNGVALPGSYHRGIHTRAYYEEVARGLTSVRNAAEARAFLRNLGEKIRQAVPPPPTPPQEQNGGG
jgi:hypothetical protein